jgi:hypothetical protein
MMVRVSMSGDTRKPVSAVLWALNVLNVEKGKGTKL